MGIAREETVAVEKNRKTNGVSMCFLGTSVCSAMSDFTIHVHARRPGAILPVSL